MTILDAAPSVTPTENIVRRSFEPGSAEFREAADGAGRTLFGHFAVFNRFTEIDSWYEGRFLEKVAPGSFTDTFIERANKIRVMYAHGHDPSIGDKPLGAPDLMREDTIGAYFESELFDAEYVNQLIPALRAGQLGSSFRFKVTGESFFEPSEASEENPQRLMERTITKVDLYEFGPVPFGAYDDATSGVRSGSDNYIERLIGNQDLLARYIERVGVTTAAPFIASLSSSLGHRDSTPGNVPTSLGGSEQASALASARAIAAARASLLAR
jgi:HK97 family phage prohead protease